ncbi:MAG: hypothetical protein ACOY8P_06815 [Thermodesulfobacteriota bacterium]|jgi:hypothetical protein
MKLPPNHRDPFDRLLVTKALCKEMALATADTALGAYGVKIIWQTLAAHPTMERGGRAILKQVAPSGSA